MSLSSSEDIPARYAATGWHVCECDGHDFADIARALAEARADPRPSLVRCRTVIGKGATGKEGTSAVHGAALGAETVAKARAAMGWTSEPFVIPDEIAADWAKAGRRGASEHVAWAERLSASGDRVEFERRMAGELTASEAIAADFAAIHASPQKMATRKASEQALEVLTKHLPELVGGSADLTGSNNTKAKAARPLTAEDYAGSYVYYGIREFGMAAAMNGMALHGGVIPYGGTFMVFTDYCRPAIRLSALQQTRVVYVMTHDSIGLGEDGPTHQPVEHVQSLRMIPNLLVMRPADAVETAECWEIALMQKDRPSVLALTRQNLPQVRHSAGNLSAKGGYRLKAAGNRRRVILIATGSEVSLALECAEALEKQGVGADVVSMVCTQLFDEQDERYRNDILPDVAPEEVLRVSIEAGTTFGWDRYTMTNGLRIGLDRFGASAPAEVLFEKFGFTADAIVPQIMNKLNG